MDSLCKIKRLLHWWTPHCSLHGPDLHSECDSELDLADNPTSLLLGHECYPFSSSLPVPLLTPTLVHKAVVNGIDPAFHIIDEKRIYNWKYQELLEKCCGVQLPEDVEKIQTNTSMTKIHPSFVSLAQHISQNHHPHLSMEYNSYYGNTVAVCNVKDDDIVIYPAPYSPKNLNALLPNLGKKSCTANKVYCVDHGLDDSQPIYQVQSSGDKILLRLTKMCALFKLSSGNNSVTMQLLCSNDTKDLFIHSCLNPYKNEYVTLTSDAIIKIHDISHSRMNCEINLNFLETDDFWGTFHFQDENVLMFCDRKTVNLLDLRTPINSSNVLQWDVNSTSERCSSIYSSIKGSDLHYVCTNHYLFSFDIRKGWFQRWAHGLANVPSLLSLVSKETRNDSLLIGCQSGGDVVNVYNDHSTDFSFDFVKAPPFRLPSLMETLHQARLKGQCLSPLITPRFSMSLTGLSAIRHSSNVDVFLCNSVGDVFSQRIDLMNKADLFTPELNDAEVEYLKLWGSECVQQHLNTKYETIASKICSFQHFQQFFDYAPSSTDIGTTVNKERLFQPWTWNKKYLEGCCDMLAPQLLSCWNLEEEDNEEWMKNFVVKPFIDQDFDSECSDDSVEDIDQRIQDWLSQTIEN